jgi:hypothetical protein
MREGAPVASLEVFGARAPTEPLGTIAIPARDHINAATTTSLLQTDWRFVGSEQAIDRLVLQGSILTLQRNEAIQRMRGRWLLFIDDDMTWEPDAIERLVDRHYELDHQFDEPVVLGGLCFRRTPPHQPTLYMREQATSGRYNFLERWDSDVVEVDATGCAFLLIPVTALEQMSGDEMPPYEVRQTMSGPPPFFRWEGKLGEDLRFCQDAKAAGCRIFVDTTIEIGHISEVRIGHRQFLQEIAMRDPDDERARRWSNERMGLPTLSREEAREQLGW